MTNFRSVHAHARMATTLYQFAGLLGADCLDNSSEIKHQRSIPLAAKLMQDIENVVVAVDPDLWRDPDGQGGFAAIIDATPGLAELLEDASAWGAAGHCAILRGLCAASLPHAFIAEDGEVALERGSVMPFAVRPRLQRLGRYTPLPATSTYDHILHPHDFDLFGRSSGELQVVLDFAHQDRVDAITWDDQRGLARVGTYHPSLRPADMSMTETPTAFFDVRPKRFDLGVLDAELRAAREAEVEVAIIPELSQPAQSGLAEALRADPKAYPPMVVAGSAHIRHEGSPGRAEVRANECRLYIDGLPALVHHKIRPYVMPEASGGRREDLTSEPKILRILCGQRTRLAVAICADIIDKLVPHVLAEAWVNTLFVPAMTTEFGAFNGALALLASSCQAFGVIVNGALDDAPFHVMAAVPVSQPRKQVQDYLADGDPHDARGTYDPNIPAMIWR
jgi:hypothetical protein